MTIEQANMYTDHLDLVYTVKGIPYAETDRYRIVTNPESDPRAFPLCGGYESYPILQMPDDSLIYAASSALGGRVLTYDPHYSFYMMHSFWGTFSSDTRIFSVLLICLPDTMRGNLSENWNLTVILTDNR
jgi:hypothetical protein